MSVVLIEEIEIHLGETAEINLLINNQGNDLEIIWNEENLATMSCTDCQNNSVNPLFSTNYQVIVSNETCQDSLVIPVLLNKKARVFAPNVFSPNFDGVNDYFYLQSPDPGSIKFLEIYDRRGSLVFASETMILNEANTGWDGFLKEEKVGLGVYVWRAEITFLDGATGLFSGEVLLLSDQEN